MLYTKFKSTFLIVIGLLVFFTAPCQNIQDSAKNEFNASVNYQSALHYFGRVDSLKSSGVFPMIGLKSKMGLYLNSTFIFVQNATTSLNYTGTILEGGYRFPYSKNFSGNIYYDHFLYQGKSVLVQSALKGQAGINTAYNNKIINVNVGGDVKFSNSQTDFGLSAGLDKLFIVKDVIENAVVAINPSAYVYSGTHNYFQNVKNNRGQTLGGLLGGSTNSPSLQQAKQFEILAYEVSAPIVFVKGKFNVYVSPAYIMPKNLVTVSGRTDLSERGSNMFYISAGVGIKL
ncbi:MAG: hypothetical protein M3004_04605 [Bacteroidota bacterium]|nr:hypothetical protein [Bacteroidota bacterium]